MRSVKGAAKDLQVGLNLTIIILAFLSHPPLLNPDVQDNVDQDGRDGGQDEKGCCTSPLVPPVHCSAWALGGRREVEGGQKLTSTRETFPPLPSFVPASIFHTTTSWREDYLSDTNYVLSPPNCANDKRGHVKVNVGHLSKICTHCLLGHSASNCI